MQDSAKEIIFKSESQKKLAAGVNTLADAVKVTMGPGGENVIIEMPDSAPVLTKDGVTVAKAIALSLPFENMGVQTVKEAAARTAETAGDGTTTATVLTQALINKGQMLVSAGCNPVKLRKGMALAREAMSDVLADMATQVESNDEIVQVGTISANGDEKIGKLLAEAIDHVGRDGVITVDEARGFDTTLDVVDGFELDRGFTSPYFITNNARGIVEFNNPKILLANRKISAVQDIVPLLESVRRNSDNLLIIADDVDNDALKVCVLNSLKSIINVCVIRAPGFGSMRAEALNDLSLLFNTRVYTPGENLPADTSELGSCESFTGYKNSSVFVGTKSRSENEVAERLSEVIAMSSHPGLSVQEMNYILRRQAVLSGGIAVIRVGGSTDLELRERKDRIDDAICATKAAVKGGIVNGGGFALLHARESVAKLPLPEDEGVRAGWQLVLDSASAPMQQIAKNAGYVPEMIIEQSKNQPDGVGFNARTGEFVDLKSAGVIDPFLVVNSALTHAVSAAINLLSVGCAIVEEDRE